MTWKLSTQTIANYPCLEHTTTGELTLAGRYGEIWQKDNNSFRAIVYNPEPIQRKLSKKRIHPTDELLFTFPASDLDKWVALLDVPVKAPFLQLDRMAAIENSMKTEPQLELKAC